MSEEESNQPARGEDEPHLNGTDHAASAQKGDAGDGRPAAEPAAPLSPEDELESARKEAADHYDQYLRAKADIENLRKRHQREMADRARYDGESLARDILQAIDDLERALEHASDGNASVIDGVDLVRKGLLAALKRNGVERIEAEGKPFDPAEHEAVTVVETDEVAPNTVIKEFRAGYKIRDRLLRAAMVSVSRAPDAKS